MALMMTIFGEMKRNRLLAEVSRAWASGDRARNWDGEKISQACHYRSGNGIEAYAHLLGYYHAFDNGDMEAARAHMAISYGLVSKHGKRWGALTFQILVEKAFFVAFAEGDAASAREALALLLESPPLDEEGRFMLSRAEAAVYLAEGDYERARASAENAIAGFNCKNPLPDNIKAEIDWAEAILARLPGGEAAP